MRCGVCPNLDISGPGLHFRLSNEYDQEVIQGDENWIE